MSRPLDKGAIAVPQGSSAPLPSCSTRQQMKRCLMCCSTYHLTTENRGLDFDLPFSIPATVRLPSSQRPRRRQSKGRRLERPNAFQDPGKRLHSVLYFQPFFATHYNQPQDH